MGNGGVGVVRPECGGAELGVGGDFWGASDNPMEMNLGLYGSISITMKAIKTGK
jgi:hypothetical protein